MMIFGTGFQYDSNIKQTAANTIAKALRAATERGHDTVYAKYGNQWALVTQIKR